MADTSQSPVAGEQPDRDSTTKATGKDQDESQAETNAKNMVEIDGEKVSLDQVKEWKKGHMMEADYRRKTQELAEAKREIARAKQAGETSPRAKEMDPEVKKAIEILKEAGMATKDDLLAMKIQEEDQKAFRKLLKSNPELIPHKKALQQIGLTDNRAWEDIAKDYGFLKDSKLEKAKAAKPITGARMVPGSETKAVDIAKMTPKEYESWKKQNLGARKWQ